MERINVAMVQLNPAQQEVLSLRFMGEVLQVRTLTKP
jgi:hypothetical protein